MSLGLAVARRALLLALVALLVAVVALVAAFVADSGSDGAAGVVDTTALAEARTAAAAAQASAEDAAIMSAASAAKADEAAVVAQEAVVTAQQAAAVAEAAAAQAAVAVEALAAAQQAAASTEGDAQPAETSDGETGAEPSGAGTDTAGAAEAGDTAKPATEAGAGDTNATTDTQDADVSDTGGDESVEASTDDADASDAGGDEPEPAVSLPGEPYESGPPDGAALAVVGVSHDSVLNVRDVPAGEIVARLDNVMNVGSEPVVYVREPDSDALIATLDLNRGVIATGNTRRLPTTIWHEIRMADAVGWASSAFLSPLGDTSDATAEVVAVLGETPGAETLVELARIVAAAVASDDPPSRVVVSGAPVIGDLGEVTVDVLGLPDDAVRGFRLQVFAQQDPVSGSFVLKSVESTTICDSHRGVSEEGLCN